MNKNDIVGIFNYAKVKEVQVGSSVVVEDMATGRQYRVVGETLIENMSNATSPEKTESVSKTKAEGLLKTAGQKPVTVVFVKTNGRERTLVGHRLGDAHFGRSLMFDLEKQAERQVDHRTLKSLVLDGVKYVVK